MTLRRRTDTLMVGQKGWLKSLYTTYLPGDILTKVDRASVAHALEVREPLLDHPMMEWLAGLPENYKLKGQEGKYILKKSLEPYLSDSILLSAQDGLCGSTRQLVSWATENKVARHGAWLPARRNRVF